MPAKDVTVEKTEEPKGLKKFVCVIDAITLSTGRLLSNRRPEVVRIQKGGTVQADPNHPDIQDLLAARALVPHTEGEAVRSTKAKELVRNLGGLADPVTPPKAEVLPVAAPAPDTAAL